MKNRLKEIRKCFGLSQQQFVEKIQSGISRDQYANYEIGRVQVPTWLISLISKELSVNETWIRTGEGEMFTPRPKREEIRDFFDGLTPGSFKEGFVLALSELGEDKWEMIADFIRKVAENAKNQAEQQEKPISREELHKMLDDELDAEERGGEKSSASQNIG